MADQVGSMRGLKGFHARLRQIVDNVEFQMVGANRENALTLQRNVVPRIPVNTGETRDAFADPAAIGQSSDPQLKGAWMFGLLTPELKKRGWKANWIEYGTKGYVAGTKRFFVRRDRKGRLVNAKSTVTRNIPARPAQPFFRPGVQAALAELHGRWSGAIRRAIQDAPRRAQQNNED